MPDLLDAVGELLHPQTMRVHPLADLTIDPPPGAPAELRYQLQQARRIAAARAYTVHAPCLLAQLHTAIGGTDVVGANLRGVARSRLPLAADALDLWVAIVTNTHAWAVELGVDRAPYRTPDRPAPAGEVRMPDWMRRLWQWSGNAVDDHGQPVPIAPLPDQPAVPVRRVPLDRDRGNDARTVPPVGQLLRAVAAAAITQHTDLLADRIGHDAHHWAGAIRSMLAGPAVDERLYPIRGAACATCGATSASEPRDDGTTYRVPAIQVRVMRQDQDYHGHWHLRPADSIDQDDAWLYQMCLACGANGWVPYTTETGAAA